MSQSPYAANAGQDQVPFAGHPFGGLSRDDRFGGPATVDDPADKQSHAEAEASSGFDFHLGVYSRF